MPPHNLSYDEQALRDHELYLVIDHYLDGVVHIVPFRTLEEAIYYAPSESSISELAKVEEVAEGVPVRKPLALIAFGVWIINRRQKELTMAKAKEATNGKASRNVESDLLGVTKPRAKKQMEVAKGQKGAKATAAPTQRASRQTFEDHQRLKVVGQRNTRPDSNVGRTLSLIKPNMTFGEFNKALDKAKIPFKASGILSFLVKDGVVQVR